MRKASPFTLVKGRRLRVTRLDGCGRPVYGDDSSAVSKGFITAGFTANTTDSDEVNVTNAAGEPIVYEASVTSLSGYSLELSFAEVDPELFSLITGQPVVTDAFGKAVGLDIDTKIITTSGFSFELWAGTGASDVCEPGTASQGSFGYILLPFLKGGIVGDFSVENGAVTFTLTGATTREGNGWGVGPYRDIQMGTAGKPGQMLKPVSTTLALRTLLVDVNPPAALPGTRPLLNPASVPLTAIAGATTVGSLTVSFTSTPAAIASPTWYDFGDGTWDYVPASALGDANHIYPVSGTYTARASTNGVWVSTTVTVAL